MWQSTANSSVRDAADLKETLSFYSDAGGKGGPTLAQEQAVALMLEKIEVISAMYHGFAYEDYFEADTAQKLALVSEQVIDVFDAAGIKKPDISILVRRLPRGAERLSAGYAVARYGNRDPTGGEDCQ